MGWSSKRRAEVLLRGGPCDGLRVDVSPGATLNVSHPDEEPGRVLRYRPSREPGVYTFRGRATVLATLPLPEEAAA